MISILESSLPGNLSISTSKLGFHISHDFSGGRKSYHEGDLLKVAVVNEDTYRNGGKAVVGAVVGGFLTGGIGFLAGAAIGGRRRQEGVYIVITRDGHNVVFKTDDKDAMMRLQIMAAKLDVNAILPEQAPSARISNSLPPEWKQPKEEKARGGAPIDPVEDRNRVSIAAPQPILDPVMLALLNQVKPSAN